MFPRFLGARADGHREQPLAPGDDHAVLVERFFPGAPQIFRALAADAGQQSDHPFEGDFIARIGDEANEGGDVLDVRLLEKTNAARDLIGNAAARKLELQLDRVIVRAVEDGDLVQLDSFVAQLENALGDELRLLAAVVRARPLPA